MGPISRLFQRRPKRPVSPDLPESEDSLGNALKRQGKLPPLGLPTGETIDTFDATDVNDVLTVAQNGRCYRLAADLGAGSYGAVKVLYDTQKGELHAAKTIPMQYLSGVQREAEAARVAKSPLAPVQIIRTTRDQRNTALLVMPLMSADLRSIGKEFKKLDQSDQQAAFSYVGRKVLRQLSYLHQQNWAHQDLKPDNIMQRGGNFLLADFGLAHKLEDLSLFDNVQGATYYASPEKEDFLDGYRRFYNPKAADVWAMGLTLTSACLGVRHPYTFFPASTTLATFHHDWRRWYATGRYPCRAVREFDLRLRGAGQPIRRLVLDMLHPNPSKRLTARKALERLEQLPKTDPSTVKAVVMQYEKKRAEQLSASLGELPLSDEAQETS